MSREEVSYPQRYQCKSHARPQMACIRAGLRENGKKDAPKQGRDRTECTRAVR